MVRHEAFTVAKYLDLLVVCYHYSFFIKFKSLAESFGASLTETHVFVPDLCPCLKKWSYRSSLDDLNFDRLWRLHKTYCASRSLIIIACVQRINVLFFSVLIFCLFFCSFLFRWIHVDSRRIEYCGIYLFNYKLWDFRHISIIGMIACH